MDKLILIADNHWTTVDGIRLFLHEKFGLTDIEVVTTCSAIMDRLKLNNYNHLIMELDFDDDTSASIIPTIKALYPSLKVAIFTSLKEDIKEYLRDYGIYHFISKHSTKEQIEKEFSAFLNGQLSIESLRKIKRNDNRLKKISPRELQILALIYANKSNDEIAHKLNIRKNSVSTMKYRIVSKR
jgi:DNA-binding NarL/FixJ family response regulator